MLQILLVKTDVMKLLVKNGMKSMMNVFVRKIQKNGMLQILLVLTDVMKLLGKNGMLLLSLLHVSVKKIQKNGMLQILLVLTDVMKLLGKNGMKSMKNVFALKLMKGGHGLMLLVHSPVLVLKLGITMQHHQLVNAMKRIHGQIKIVFTPVFHLNSGVKLILHVNVKLTMNGMLPMILVNQDVPLKKQELLIL